MKITASALVCYCFFFPFANTTRNEILIADSLYYFIQIELAAKIEHIHTHAKLRALLCAMRSTRLLVYSHTRRRRLKPEPQSRMYRAAKASRVELNMVGFCYVLCKIHHASQLPTKQIACLPAYFCATSGARL